MEILENGKKENGVSKTPWKLFTTRAPMKIASQAGVFFRKRSS